VATTAAIRTTRRALIGRAGAAAGAIAAASVAGLGFRAPAALAQGSGDADLLRRAIALEQLAAFSTTALLARGVLRQAARAAGERFRGQQQQHLDVLESALQAAGGGKAPAPPRSVAETDRALGDLGRGARLADVHSQADAIAFEIALQETAIGGWYEALRELQDRRLIAVAAQVMANEAQQLTVWRSLQSDAIVAVVPSAFEHGSAPAG
jgi:rubrerythrin